MPVAAERQLASGEHQAGLAIGSQSISHAWGVFKVLNLGHTFEQATEWHTQGTGMVQLLT
jgi:Asp-tRNA(Asn)/Glu-tRNA(Gln) amidotransferase A subunit family amidase